MKPLRSLMVPLAVLLAMLLAGIPAAGAASPVTPGPQEPTLTVAVAEATSPATGHLFLVSSRMNAVTGAPGASWLSMLESRTGKLLRIVPVAAGEHGLLVDDATQHVFVLSGGNGTLGAAPLVLQMLDTRSGDPLGSVALGSGTTFLWTMQAASRLGLLFAITNPNPAHPELAPSTLHVFDTKTGRQLHTLQVPAGYSGLLVHQSTARLYLATGTSTLRIYDLHTWRLVKTLTFAVSSPLLGAVDEAQSRVALITGRQSETLMLLDAASGAIRKQLALPASQYPATAVMDEQTNHLFIVAQGTYDQETELATDGALITVNMALGVIVHTTPLGFGGMHAAIDGATHRLLVLTYNRANQVGYVSRASALVSTLDTRSGSLLRAAQIPITDVQDLATIVVDGRAAMAFVNATGFPIPPERAQGRTANTVTILDTRTGALVRTITVPESMSQLHGQGHPRGSPIPLS